MSQARHFVSVASVPETTKNNDSSKRIDLYRLRSPLYIVTVWSQQILPHLQTSRSSVSKTNEIYVCGDISIYRRMAKIEQKMVSNNTNASKSRKWFWTQSKSEVEKNGTGDENNLHARWKTIVGKLSDLRDRSEIYK